MRIRFITAVLLMSLCTGIPAALAGELYDIVYQKYCISSPYKTACQKYWTSRIINGKDRWSAQDDCIAFCYELPDSRMCNWACAEWVQKDR